MNQQICISKRLLILSILILLIFGYVFFSSTARTTQVGMNSRASEKVTGIPINQKRLSILILKDLKSKAQEIIKTARYEVKYRIMQGEFSIDEARKALIDQSRQSMKVLSDYGDLLREAKLNSDDELSTAQKKDESSKRELDQSEGVLLIAEENSRQSGKEVASREEEVIKAKELVERTNEIQSNYDESLLLELRAEVSRLKENYQKSMTDVDVALGNLINQLNQNVFSFVPRAFLAEWSLGLVDVKDSEDITPVLQAVNTIESSNLYGPLLLLSPSTRDIHENLKEKLSVAFEKKIMYEGKANVLKTAELESTSHDMAVFKVAVQLGYEKALSDLERSRKQYAGFISEEKNLRGSVDTLKKSYEKNTLETSKKQRERDMLITVIMEVTRVKTDLSKIERSARGDADIPLANLIEKADMPKELNEVGKFNRNVVNEEIDKINDLLWKTSELYESFDETLQDSL